MRRDVLALAAALRELADDLELLDEPVGRVTVSIETRGDRIGIRRTVEAPDWEPPTGATRPTAIN